MPGAAFPPPDLIVHCLRAAALAPAGGAPCSHLHLLIPSSFSLMHHPHPPGAARAKCNNPRDVGRVLCRSNALLNFGSADARGEAAEKLAAAQPRAVVYNRRRKLDLAQRLQARWLRWELSNFDYLMQVRLIWLRQHAPGPRPAMTDPPWPLTDPERTHTTGCTKAVCCDGPWAPHACASREVPFAKPYMPCLQGGSMSSSSMAYMCRIPCFAGCLLVCSSSMAAADGYSK